MPAARYTRSLFQYAFDGDGMLELFEVTMFDGREWHQHTEWRRA